MNQNDNARIIGVDLARLVALIGMFAAHLLVADDSHLGKTVCSLVDGRASVLFALLAGVSLTLISGRAQVPAGDRQRIAGTIGVRALLIVLLGLALGQLPTPVMIILVQYGVLFAVAVPFLFLRTRTLAIVATVWLFSASVLTHGLRGRLPAFRFDFDSTMSPSFHSFDDIPNLLNGVLLNGEYPVITWSAYLLVGVLVGRLTLTRLRTAAGLALAGAVLAGGAYGASAIAYAGDLPSYEMTADLVNGSKPDTFAGPVDEHGMPLGGQMITSDQNGNPIENDGSASQPDGADSSGDSGFQAMAPEADGPTRSGKSGAIVNGAAVDQPQATGWKGELAIVAHSQTLLDVLQTAGFALLALAGALGLGRLLGRAGRVLTGAGAITLTLYTVHILGWRWKAAVISAHPWPVLIGQVGIAIAIGAGLAWRGWKGPLEWSVTAVSAGAGRLISTRHRPQQGV